MGASDKFISNLSKDKYTIKANSTQTISFMGASPNYYRITNGGNTALYLGVSMMPTEKFFDMKISPGTTKLYVDAYGHEEVYIFNPSNYDTNIIITSFYSSFDSTVLALSDIGQDFSSIDFSGSVDASGDLKDMISSIKASAVADTPNITIMKNNSNIIMSYLNVLPCTKFYTEENTDAEHMYTFNHIEFFANDGDTDIIALFGSNRCILKPGEVLNKVLLSTGNPVTIKIPKYSTYRLIGG